MSTALEDPERGERDIDVLEATSRGGTYKRRIHEREVCHDNEVWTLSWTGKSEMLVDGRWLETEETEHFPSRRAAVYWMAEGFPTLH